MVVELHEGSMHACRVRTNMLNSSVLAFTTVHLAQFLRTPGRKGGGGEGGLCRMPSSAATFSLFFHIRAHFFTFFSTYLNSLLIPKSYLILE